jgi:hypothetical protein
LVIINITQNLIAGLTKIKLDFSNNQTDNNQLDYQTVNSNKNFLDQQGIFTNIKSVTPPPGLIFKSVSRGVEASEDIKTKKRYIKISSGAKYRIFGTVTINGREYPRIEFVNE